jgi:hypothetical protein
MVKFHFVQILRMIMDMEQMSTSQNMSLTGFSLSVGERNSTSQFTQSKPRCVAQIRTM